MDDLRKFALDMAATSMRGAPFTEIVLAAQAFHAFLVAGAVDFEAAVDRLDLHFHRTGNPPLSRAGLEGLTAACLGIEDPNLASEQPPPLPDLVQQVAAVASAPPGCRSDLSQADQTPQAIYERAKGPGEWSAKDGLTNRFSTDDDDTKTRIISRAHREQFSEPTSGFLKARGL